MNWDAIGAIGEIIGAIAVVATLGYLAVQVRQNTRVAKAEISQRMSEQVQNLDAAILTSPDAGDLLDRARDADSELSGADFWRLASFAMARIDHAENLHYQYRAETLDKSRLDSLMIPVLYNFQALPRLRRTWSSVKDNVDPSFCAYMEAALRVEDHAL